MTDQAKEETKKQDRIKSMTNRELFNLCGRIPGSADEDFNHFALFTELEKRLLRTGFLPTLPPKEEEGAHGS